MAAPCKRCRSKPTTSPWKGSPSLIAQGSTGAEVIGNTTTGGVRTVDIDDPSRPGSRAEGNRPPDYPGGDDYGKEDGLSPRPRRRLNTNAWPAARITGWCRANAGEASAGLAARLERAVMRRDRQRLGGRPLLPL